MSNSSPLTPLEWPAAATATPPAEVVRAPLPGRGGSRAGWIWFVIAAVIGAGAYGIWRYSRTPADAAAASGGRKGAAGAAPIPVVAVTARTGDIDVYYTGLGSVTPVQTVTVKSRVDGQLLSVHYKEGDLVHKGDPLAEIDPRPYQVQLTVARGQLAKDQASLENARIDLARNQALLAKGLIPQQTLATQESLVAEDIGVVQTDQGQIDSANLNIAFCHITALITGRVGLRLVDPGNMVHASDANGLLVITQMQPISVIFTIPEDELQVVLKKIRAGQKLAVEAADRDMKTKLAEGVLSSIDNQIDPTTGTLRLRATFDNESATLFPNQFINIRLLVDEKRGVTVVQTAAVQRNAQATYVFVVKPDKTVTSRPVTMGVSEGDDSEITAGLVAGDVVVMTGIDKLQEGSKVDAQFAKGQK